MSLNLSPETGPLPENVAALPVVKLFREAPLTFHRSCDRTHSPLGRTFRRSIHRPEWGTELLVTVLAL